MPPGIRLERRRCGRALPGWVASVVFCGPAVLLYIGFMVLPAVLGGYYSLTRWSG